MTAQRRLQKIRRMVRLLAISLLMVGLSADRAVAATICTYRFGAGAATFGMALPQGAATAGVQVGSLTTQTDVKNRWPDGSIKFAVVSAIIPTTGTYAIASAAAPSGAFTPSRPAIVLSLVINGAASTAILPGFDPTNSWLSGPVVRETRSVVVPSRGGPDPQLEVIFDVRSYVNGTHRVDLTVQNTRDAVTMDKVTVTGVSLTSNGSVAWSHGPVTSYSMTRWRQVVWIGGTEAEVTPDFEPTYLSGALPRVLGSVSNKTYDITGANYDLMGGRPASGYPAFAYGEMTPDMAAGGGRQEIGPLDWWEAVYLIHKTQNQRKAVLRNGDLSGAWSNHLTKPDGSIIKLGDSGYNPATWWWDPRAPAGSRPLAPLNAMTAWRGAREGASPDTDTGSAGVASRYNEEHVPAPMYVPYLISGDRYYVDQAKLWSAKAILNAPPGWQQTDPINFPGWKRGRNGATGNERILDMTGMTREFGWPLRLVGVTTWMIPDADADRGYFVTTVQNNLNHAAAYLDTWVRLGYGGTLGAIGGSESASGWSLRRNGQETGRYTSNWRLAYTAYALDWCTRQGIWTIPPSVDTLIDRIVNLAIQMNIQNADFLSGKSGLSHPYYAVFNTMSGGTFTRWFNTFAEVKTYNETYPYQDEPAVGNVAGWNPKESGTGYYNADHHLVLQIGMRRGLPNADVAWNRLLRVPGHSEDLNLRAGFAITFSKEIAGRSTKPLSPANLRILR